VGPDMTPGKVYECSELQKVPPKIFDFCKIKKIAHPPKNMKIYY